MYKFEDYLKDRPELALKDTIDDLLKTIEYLTGDLYNIGLEIEGLKEERDTLAEENGHFANFLERMDYSPCEIDNISNGWYTYRTTDLDKDKRIKELERKLMTIMDVANDANEED